MGEIVLAYKYKVRTRAEVVEVLINNCYKLRLFDFGVEVKVGLGDICKATQDLMNFPALVSKCALDSFYHSQSHLLHQNRNQRLKVLMRELETIQVDVIDVKEGLDLVRVPAVEDQLAQYSLLLLSSQCGGVTDPLSRYFTDIKVN